MTGDQQIHEEMHRPQPVAVMEATLTVAAIGPWLAEAFGAVATAVAAQGIALAGPPFARYRHDGDGTFTVEAGFPVGTAIADAGPVRPGELPGGSTAVMIHIGPYEAMEPAYAAVHAWIDDHGGTPSGPPWEVYLSDPAEQPDPTTWQTRIVQPYRPA
ncbi:MAG: GyrI-like domain-containing protein [Kineosporiaceae bacterium]|nr:GyrI-like domain-containing protein [Kineosporiaceae bacterium]MBK8077863.1 GyrI-like domain-containing protein [Kineosporiaceae bacterium]